MGYRIGGLKIDVSRLNQMGCHRFIVDADGTSQAPGTSVSFYASMSKAHGDVAKDFLILTTGIVGGGSLYVDEKNKLVVTDSSGDFHAIPKYAAQKFGELLVPELKKQGIRIDGLIANPYGFLNSFWHHKEPEHSYEKFRNFWRPEN